RRTRRRCIVDRPIALLTFGARPARLAGPSSLQFIAGTVNLPVAGKAFKVSACVDASVGRAAKPDLQGPPKIPPKIRPTVFPLDPLGDPHAVVASLYTDRLGRRVLYHRPMAGKGRGYSATRSAD